MKKSLCQPAEAFFYEHEYAISNKKAPLSMTKMLSVGSGRRIRTLTNGVRVRCATITQFRYEQMILYRYFRICQPSWRIFFAGRSALSPAPPANAGRAGETGAQRSRILPSIEIVTTCHGRNFPLARSASRAACSSPPQHGTSMRTMVTL